MRVASSSTATASPTPICLMSSVRSEAKIANTATITAAALVTVDAVVRMPCATASSVGMPRSTSSSTPDPVGDLVEAGVTVFRRFAIEHPSLFRLAVQRTLTSPQLAAQFNAAAQDALAGLEARVARASAAGLLGNRTTRDTVWQLHALCEGLAPLELRGLTQEGQEERLWRDALAALVTGFAVLPAHQQHQ